MTYLVLARKYRPRNFSSLVGQEHVVKALRHALEKQRLHHAYLFTGTRGVGKTTIARILAKCLNCETGITPEPCGKCGACLEIDGGRFPDLIEIDAATNTGIDDMRELQDNAAYVPVRGRFKIFVIDEVHMLSKPAFNSMLKTLEEPPEHLKFILATTDPQKIPVTVLSRCLQFNLKQMPQGAITEHLARLLEAEKIEFEREALAPLARAAAGSMRDGLSLLDQAIAHGAGRVSAANVREMLGAVDETYLLRALDALAAGDGPALMGLADEMQSRSLSFDVALADLASLLLRIAVAGTMPEALEEDLPERERVIDFAKRFAADEIQLNYQIAVQGRQDLPLAPDEHAGFLMTLLRMLAFRPEGASLSPGGMLAMPEKSPARPDVSRAAPVQSAQSAARPAAKTPVTPGVPFGGDWVALVRELKLGGAAKLLADNSELKRHDSGQFDLAIPKAMAYLADRGYVDKLKAALVERFGGIVTLKVAVGEVQGDSVAALEQGERSARQAKAENAVRGDPFVRDLVDIFDATVIDNTIHATPKGS
jgi:DNA polymerase-3 subunit gamma/tau